MIQGKRKEQNPPRPKFALHSCLINDIIMILYKSTNFNTICNQDAYIASIAALNIASIACPFCGVVGLFIFYGTYSRRFFSDDGIDASIDLLIKRIQCTSCRRTQALIPCSLVPYSRFSYIAVCSILDGDDQELEKVAISYQIAYEYIKAKKERIKKVWSSRIPDYEFFSHMKLLELSISLYGLPFGCTHKCTSCILSQPT